MKANELIYKKRQAIVEHPFGTIKRQWGFDYIMTKRIIVSASADVGLMALAYNLKRIINLMKASKTKEKIHPCGMNKHENPYLPKMNDIIFLNTLDQRKQEISKIVA